ncbi:hypothetical protein DL93DRAFT_674298 [Clavulina sp. PMI_390]|nr:hypothetical protein DL93DRAFT_674298 [Clavulina sp. PMI_390]
MLADKNTDPAAFAPVPETVDAPPAYTRVFRATTDPLPAEPLKQDEPSSSKAPDPPLPVIDEPVEPVKASGSFITPPANYVAIRDTHGEVKGSWTIDTSLARPAFLRPTLEDPSSPTPSSSSTPPPQPQGFFSKLFNMGPGVHDKYAGSTPHLKLYSTHGKVDANVRVVRGSSRSLPARLDVRSTHGAVKLTIASRGKQRLNIVAVSTHGSVEVFLPRDFRGLVRHRTSYGSFTTSPAIDAQLNTFSMEKGVGTSFIGDWSTIDFSRWSADFVEGANGPYASSGSDDWPVDMLTIDSTYGSMKIKYNNEREWSLFSALTSS